MKVLVTGGGGQLGRALRAPRRRAAADARRARRSSDASRGRARRSTRERPDVVINAAAYTAVDRAEAEPRRGLRAPTRRRRAPSPRACAARGARARARVDRLRLRRRAASAVREDDPIAPARRLRRQQGRRRAGRARRAPGRARRAHVVAVLRRRARASCTTILRLARERPVLRVVADQHGCPTFAGDLARALARARRRAGRPAAIYHFCRRRADDLARVRRPPSSTRRAGRPRPRVRGRADRDRRVPDARRAGRATRSSTPRSSRALGVVPAALDRRRCAPWSRARHDDHPRHRRRRLHRLQLRPAPPRRRAARPRVVVLDKLTYAGNPRSLARARRRAALRASCAATSATARSCASCSRRTGPTPSSTSPPRATSTARSSAPTTSSRPTSSARSTCSTRRGTRSAAASCPTGSDSSTSRPTRSTARSAPTGCFTEAVAATSRARPTRPRRRRAITWSAPTTTPTALPVDHHELLEQLRAVSVPREAHPAHHRQRAAPASALPVYGRGENVRDWIYVEDHCRALARSSSSDGRIGETYVVGARNERKNLDVVQHDLRRARRAAPARRRRRTRAHRVRRPTGPATTSATPSTRRRSSASSASAPRVGFEDGIRRTIRWYVEHEAWTAAILSGEYQRSS